MKKSLLILSLSLIISACDSKEEAKPAAKVEDNPLLKMQHETAGKAEKFANQAIEQQSKALEEAGQ